MPTYEYICQKCEHHFEQFQSMTASLIRKCPRCGKNSVKRLIGKGAGIIFKGSGFYETDYRSDSYKKGQKGEPAKTETMAQPKKAESVVADKTQPKQADKSESKPKEEKKSA
jgi:putative FmdB family regulatory protein